MAEHVIRRLPRGSTTRLKYYVGPAGELVMNTTTNHVLLQTGRGNVTLANLTDIPQYQEVTTTTAGLMSAADKNLLEHLSNTLTPVGGTSGSSGVSSGDPAVVNVISTYASGSKPLQEVKSQFKTNDANGRPLGGLETKVDIFGTVSTSLVANKSDSLGVDSAKLGIYYPQSGTPYTEAPTPVDGDVSNKIATTAFCRGFFSDVSFTDGVFTFTKSNGETKSLVIGGSAENPVIIDEATGTTAGLMSAADKAKLDSLSVYELPVASSTTLGGVRAGTTITNTTGLAPCPIIDGVPYYAVSSGSSSATGFTSADKYKLDTIEEHANFYQLPTASQEVVGGVRSGSVITSTDGLTPCPIISGVPYYKASSLDGSALAVQPAFTNGVLLATVTIADEPVSIYAPPSAISMIVSTLNGTTNTVTTNDNTYLVLKDGDTVIGRLRISGSGPITVNANDGSIVISADNLSYSEASPTQAGLMSANDKIKLDSLTNDCGELE